MFQQCHISCGQFQINIHQENKMYLAVLIVTMLSPVHCEDFHLNGASFLQQADLSLGYAQWLVVSAFDTSYLQEDFLTLEEMKKSLFNYIEEQGGIAADNVILWKFQIATLEAISKKAKERYKDLNIYIGNIDEEIPDKRDAGLTTAGISLAAKVGSSLYDLQKVHGKTEKLDLFIQRYNDNLRNLNSTISELVNYKEDQLSFNRNILHRLFEMEKNIETLQKEIQKLNTGFRTHLTIQYHFAFLIEAYRQLIKYQEEILRGLIEASKGHPRSPFLSPNRILNLMENYEEDETSEKSFFGKEDVLEVFNLVESSLAKQDQEVAVVSKVKLPTANTKARLFKIISYPVMNSQNQKFVTLRTAFQYIAVNGRSEYLLLTSEDVNSCQVSESILLCENSDRLVWTPRDVASCESSTFFEDFEKMEALCDYDVLSSEEPQINFVNNGVFHFSVASELSVPLECLKNGEQTSTNLKLNNSGFLYISKDCKANIQGNILENLMAENVETYFIEPDLSFHNLDQIRNLKVQISEEAVKDKDQHLTLNNDEIIESIKDKELDKQRIKKVEDLFLSYKKTATQAEKTKLDFERDTQQQVEALLQNDLKIDQGFRNLDIVILVQTVAVSFLLAAAFFLLFWYLKKRPTSS